MLYIKNSEKGVQAYKIHRTMGPQVPEKNWPRSKMFKTKKLKK